MFFILRLGRKLLFATYWQHQHEKNDSTHYKKNHCCFGAEKCLCSSIQTIFQKEYSFSFDFLLPEPNNVAIASFYPETEYFKEGIVILKNLSPEQQAKLSYGLIPYPKIPRDPKVEVYLERSPSNSYQFNEKEALKRGVSSFYSQSSRNTGFLVVIDGETQNQQENLPLNIEPLKGSSFISIKFIPQTHSNEITPKEHLNKYIAESKLRYLEKVPIFPFECMTKRLGTGELCNLFPFIQS